MVLGTLITKIKLIFLSSLKVVHIFGSNRLIMSASTILKKKQWTLQNHVGIVRYLNLGVSKRRSPG